MSTSSRRGACPTLAAPMATGDGLLVRLTPLSGGVTPAQLAGLARAAREFGNGQIEITGRGNLQIRGLTEEALPGLNDAVVALGLQVREGVPIDIAPLAGLDPLEIVDPRPLAQAGAIAAKNLGDRLGPKVSVVIDGGGRSMLDAIKADIRLEAEIDGAWRMSLAGDKKNAQPVGRYDEAGALAAALDTLASIASLGRHARGRDLVQTGSISQPSCQSATLLPFGEAIPLSDGRYALRVAFAFGAIDAPRLAGFAEQLEAIGVTETRLCPERSLLLLCDDQQGARNGLALAGAGGFIVRGDDARLAIVACAGAPACASAHFATRPLAEEIASTKTLGLADGVRLHLSGCAKRCAELGGPSIALIGAADGNFVVANGAEASLPLRRYFQKRGLIRPENRQAS